MFLFEYHYLLSDYFLHLCHYYNGIKAFVCEFVGIVQSLGQVGHI